MSFSVFDCFFSRRLRFSSNLLNGLGEMEFEWLVAVESLNELD